MLQGPPTRITVSVADGSRPATEILVSPFVIGRDSDCDLVVDDPQASPRHAQIEVQPDGRVVLRDLGSEAGTFVGDSRIEGGAWLAGDSVAVGIELADHGRDPLDLPIGDRREDR